MNIEFTSVKEVLTTIKSDLIEAKQRIIERQKAIDNDLMDCERALKALEKQEPETPKTNGRLPKVGDELISITNKYFDKDEEVEVIYVDDDYFDVIRENSTICKCIYISSLHKIFRFKDEQPTPETPIHEARQQVGEKIDLAKSVNATSPEDLANLHSFQHVNRKEDELFTHMSKEHDVVLVGSELDEIRNIVQNENNEAKKKPYRIKTREEMLRDGAEQCLNESIYLFHSNFSFTNMMGYLHGRELDTNTKQRIKAEPHHPVEYWKIDTWMITENN